MEDDDLRDSPALRRALIALLEKEPRTATEFQHAARISVAWAVRLRTWTERRGLTRSEEQTEGSVRRRLVFLTDLGREAARAAAAYEAALDRAEKKAR